MSELLILQNAKDDGLGTLQDFLVEKDIAFTHVNLWRGEPIPEVRFKRGKSAYQGLIVLGGHMSAAQDSPDNKLYPYLEKECEILRRFVDADRGVFGICLGAQLLARALGKKVSRGAASEIGWFDVQATPQGAKDPMWMAFSGDASKCEVFQWHEDTFELPEGAVRLASSPLYSNQAFRLGHKVYAVQFHPEVGEVEIKRWLEAEGPGVSPELRKQEILSQTLSKAPLYQQSSRRLFDYICNAILMA